MKHFALLGLLIPFFAAGIDGVVITVDTSQAPELDSFGARVKVTLEDWFFQVGQILDSPTYVPPATITVFFDPAYDGVAYASGGRIVGSVNYYRTHQEDLGSMVHEMAHVIQGYRKCDGWVTEGLADWVRYFHYEPNNKPSKPGPNNHWTQGYGVAAYFLDYINSRYVPMNYWINKDCREGIYDESIFQRLTSKSVQQLWDDMLREG